MTPLLTRGLIVPAGSTLAQFEIQRYADGVVDENLPHVVWVDAGKPLEPWTPGIGCNCRGPFYPIRDGNGAEISTIHEGGTPSVCLCMGRFVE